MEELMQILAQMFAAEDDGSLNPNGIQDLFQMLSDPNLIGSMGDQGGYDPAAFAEVPDGFDEYDMPTDPYAPYAGLAATSMESTIANAVKNGGSPSEVVAQLELEGEEATAALKLANDLFTKGHEFQVAQAALPEGGQVMGDKYKVPKFKPSKAAQEYIDQGLPLPTERFTADNFADVTGSGERFAESSQDSARAGAATSRAMSALRQFQTMQGLPTPTRPGALPQAQPQAQSAAVPHQNESPDMQAALAEIVSANSGMGMMGDYEDPYAEAYPDPPRSEGGGDLGLGWLKGLIPSGKDLAMNAIPGGPAFSLLGDMFGAGRGAASAATAAPAVDGRDFSGAGIGTPLSQGAGGNPSRVKMQDDQLKRLREQLASAQKARTTQMDTTSSSFLESFRNQRVGNAGANGAASRGETPLSMLKAQRAAMLAAMGGN